MPEEVSFLVARFSFVVPGSLTLTVTNEKRENEQRETGGVKARPGRARHFTEVRFQ